MVLISIPISIVGATTDFTATYVQEPYIQFTQGSGPYAPNKFVCLLGTMTLSINNPPVSLKEPSVINVNSTSEFRFTGLRDYNGYQLGSGGFYLDTVTCINSNTSAYRISRIDHEIVLLSNST
jgi:hypothetical protein